MRVLASLLSIAITLCFLTTGIISQNKLAVALGIERTIVNRWFHERVDPSAETVADIVKALKEINSAAAEMFVELYLSELIKNEDEPHS